MGSNRLHKLWSIFERVTGLIESKVMLEENKPLWYDVYKRYPPKLNPHFSQPAEMVPIKPIFYPEDKLRSQLHKSVPDIIMDLNEKSTKTFTVMCQELIDQGLTMDKAISGAHHVIFASKKEMKERDDKSKENIYVVDKLNTNKK